MGNEANKNQTPAADAKLISVTPEQLQQLIKDGVVAVTKELQAEAAAETTRFGQMDMDKLGEVIGNSVAAGMAKLQRPKVAFGSYIRRPYSCYHTEGVGDHQRPKLNKEVLINGAPAHDRVNVNDEEIRLLNQITHSGRYCDRLVEVIERTDAGTPTFEIRFSNKIENYMPLHAKWPDLEAILREVVDKQLVEAEEKELQDEQRRALRAEAAERSREKRSAAGKVVLAEK